MDGVPPDSDMVIDRDSETLDVGLVVKDKETDLEVLREKEIDTEMDSLSDAVKVTLGVAEIEGVELAVSDFDPDADGDGVPPVRENESDVENVKDMVKDSEGVSGGVMVILCVWVPVKEIL